MTRACRKSAFSHILGRASHSRWRFAIFIAAASCQLQGRGAFSDFPAPSSYIQYHGHLSLNLLSDQIATFNGKPDGSSTWRWCVWSSFFNGTNANRPLAGPSGLAALKNLREEGFSATVFEKRASVGGVWAYTDDVDTTTALPCEAQISIPTI
jgi:hypothetical protein